MSDFASTRPSSGLAGRLAFGAVGLLARSSRAAFDLVAAEIDRRRTAALLELDDHHLKDIGITRGEVYGSLLTAAGEKASEHLSRVRCERREAERSRIREALMQKNAQGSAR